MQETYDRKGVESACIYTFLCNPREECKKGLVGKETGREADAVEDGNAVIEEQEVELDQGGTGVSRRCCSCCSCCWGHGLPEYVWRVRGQISREKDKGSLQVRVRDDCGFDHITHHHAGRHIG